MKKIFWILTIVLLITNSFGQSKDYRIDNLNGIKVIEKENWGSLEVKDTVKPQELKYITIHHSGEYFDKEKDVVKYLKNLQKWCINEKKWIDIPYHFMIDLSGKIYEARKMHIPGDTNTKYNPYGHILINVIGNYEIQTPNELQINSLVNLVAALSDKYDIPLNKIASHKDYSDDTVCPGKNLYKYLADGSLLKKVKIAKKDR